MSRLSPAADSFFAGLLAAVEAVGVEIREGIDYRTAHELSVHDWLDSLDSLIEIADDLRTWARQQIESTIEQHQ